MAIDLKLIDKLLADYKKPEDIIGEDGLLKQLTKAVLERALQAEMTDHLGYEKHDPAGHNSGNSRNGVTTKTLKGDFGEVPLETPLNRGQGGPTIGSVNPGVIWSGKYFQVGAEAMIPVNSRTGNDVGFIAQLHFYLDDLFPHSLGRPLFGGNK